MLFSIMAVPIYIPTNSAQASLISICLPILVICLLDDICSKRCEVIACYFELHFHDD